MIEIVESCLEGRYMFYKDTEVIFKDTIELTQVEYIRSELKMPSTKDERLRLYELIKLTEC